LIRPALSQPFPSPISLPAPKKAPRFTLIALIHLDQQEPWRSPRAWRERFTLIALIALIHPDSRRPPVSLSGLRRAFRGRCWRLSWKGWRSRKEASFPPFRLESFTLIRLDQAGPVAAIPLPHPLPAPKKRSRFTLITLITLIRLDRLCACAFRSRFHLHFDFSFQSFSFSLSTLIHLDRAGPNAALLHVNQPSGIGTIHLNR
jgi:hypothetical protein